MTKKPTNCCLRKSNFDAKIFAYNDQLKTPGAVKFKRIGFKRETSLKSS